MFLWISVETCVYPVESSAPDRKPSQPPLYTVSSQSKSWGIRGQIGPCAYTVPPANVRHPFQTPA
jgi:hypothetical protein